MNIFILDGNPRLAAEYHCDKHVVKMILESAQLLSTAHSIHGTPVSPSLYKPTHINHPCSKWVRESESNYKWLYRLFEFLLTEYTARYNKYHACERLRPFLSHTYTMELIDPSFSINIGECTTPALAMPDEYKTDNCVESYRNYYKSKEKKMSMTWKTKTPEWFKTYA